MTSLSKSLGRPANLDDITDAELDRLAAMGFDWVWFLSVWRTGNASRKVSCENQQWRQEFEETLPDLCDNDIAGSGFAITGYEVHPDLGGDAALARLRKRLAERGLKLMLDFVPNHMALDHPWVEDHPEYFVAGTENALAREPQNYIRLNRKKENLILAYGRDPNFSGWQDTLQLDYSNPATQEAMIVELQKIACQCDGVRCDMAMLALPEVFERTWGRKSTPFWPHAIQLVHERNPNFCFMAEVYWDLEWTLQQQGFDYTYDKRLYDRLREGHTRPVREHLYAELNYQNKLARFLENHDEPRAASTFEQKIHEAAAIITFLSPGLRFFHQGEFEGYKKHISPHLVRAPLELVDQTIGQFYDKLLEVIRLPAVRDGQWRLLECSEAWGANGSWDAFLAFSWEDTLGNRLLVVVNYAPHQSQCYIRLPYSDLAGRTVQFNDLMSSAIYEYKGDDLLSSGFYVDIAPWSYYVFEQKQEVVS